MFAGSAAGEFLPPMVVYKTDNVYENWVKSGSVGSIYDATQSGWFDMRTFDLWFFKQFLPVASQMPGRKVLIGDNLGLNFSAKVIEACKTNDVLFICLPPNSTHLCQPLDVAVFRALKVEWKDILDTWRRESKSKANLPKTIFPGFIYFKFVKTVNFTLLSPTHPIPRAFQVLNNHVMKEKCNGIIVFKFFNFL